MIALGSNAHTFARPSRRQALPWCFEAALGCGPVRTVDHAIGTLRSHRSWLRPTPSQRVKRRVRRHTLSHLGGRRPGMRCRQSLCSPMTFPSGSLIVAHQPQGCCDGGSRNSTPRAVNSWYVALMSSTAKMNVAKVPIIDFASA